MDRRLHLAARTGDVDTLLALFQEDKHIIEQRSSPTLSTALHIAAKLGHIEFVAEIVRLTPELVAAENAVMETAFHEACREGHHKVSMLLVGADPTVAYRLNCDNQSALFVACGRGHLQIARSLLVIPWLLGSEDNGSSTSLHEASIGGHIDIVKEICKLRPDFIWRRDSQGYCPLHLSSSKGHLDITREFLKIDSDLAIARDNEGRTPLHLATIKGSVNIIHEIITASTESAQVLTNDGESVMHLAVKNNRYEALRYLTENTACTDLMNLPDSKGNTVLHMAVTAKLLTTVRYLTTKAAQFLDVNAVNQSGHTALDIITTNDSNSSGALQVVDLLQTMGAKCNHELLLQVQSPVKQRANGHTFRPQNHCRGKKTNKEVESPTRHRKLRERRLKSHREGLRNARNTIVIVAVLVSTVAFSSGVTPPGGVYQEGKSGGKAIAAMSTAFKVFMVSNTLALFISLALVTVLVSIIPFRRKSMMVLLVVTHKVMWAAVMFMAVAYVAAMWVVVPVGRGTRWLLAIVLSVSGGVVGLVFLALLVMLVKHWVRKVEWKEKREQKDGTNGSNSTNVSGLEELRERRKASSNSSNSDLDSSEKSGYHTY